MANDQEKPCSLMISKSFPFILPTYVPWVVLVALLISKRQEGSSSRPTFPALKESSVSMDGDDDDDRLTRGKMAIVIMGKWGIESTMYFESPMP